jgi:predicted nuclease with TOPRIM domain
VCGHEHYFDWVKNFDTIRLRKCPGCGVTDDTNEKEYLIKKQHDIEQEIKSCQERLKVLNVGLLEVTEKLKNIPEVCNVST